jgi:hypothetical protein
MRRVSVEIARQSRLPRRLAEADRRYGGFIKQGCRGQTKGCAEAGGYLGLELGRDAVGDAQADPQRIVNALTRKRLIAGRG